MCVDLFLPRGQQSNSILVDLDCITQKYVKTNLFVMQVMFLGRGGTRFQQMFRMG